MPAPISATVLTKNSQPHIRECLDALKRLDEVVVLDNGSTDDTIRIARAYPNVRVHTGEFIGFGPLKNLAASYATHDWIFSVDSDEVASEGLVENLLKSRLKPDEVGIVHRRNYYDGRLIDACGWQNDFVPRLYNRTRTRFNDKRVHESLLTGNVRRVALGGDLSHHPYRTASELLHKLQLYSSLFAEENRFARRSSPLKAVGAALATFFKSYVIKKGFLYGSDGLLISASHANGGFYKYMKLYEANKKLSVSLVITTYNREDALELTLMSVLRQSSLPDEVIVADDGSRGDTRELVERYGRSFPVPLIHCWQPDEGFRLAQIRNKAIASAKGEYVVLVDGDMILHKDFIKSHKASARKSRFIQGSRVWLSEEATGAILEKKSVDSLPPLFKMGNSVNAVNLPSLSRLFSRRVRHTRGVRGCNMSFWREDCIKVNGFNEEFTGWGREDSEFVVRMMNSGLERINLRFGGVAYHLFHPPGSRSSLGHNDLILQRAIEEKTKRCDNGISKFV